MVTELGHNGTENIHIHGILWTDEEEKIERIWKYGWVWIGDYVSSRTVNYMTKYVNKIDVDHKYYKPKILTSAGIGSKYTYTSNSKLNKYNEQETDETYRTDKGNKIGLPIYWRNKIYSDEEREKLWIKKINKEERYILGKKIKINTEQGEENYWKLLKVAQEKNKRLGYGSDEINWDRKIYEIERRRLMYEKRLKGLTDKNRKEFLMEFEVSVAVAQKDKAKLMK